MQSLPNQKLKEAFKLTSQNTTPFKASINPGAKYLRTET
jgi:hypothetical protein